MNFTKIPDKRKGFSRMLKIIGNAGSFIALAAFPIFSTVGEIKWMYLGLGTLDKPMQLNSICNRGNEYVAVCKNGRITYSNGLLNWKEQTSPALGDLNSVIFANEKFVAVGAEGSIVYSSDGKTWSKSSYNDKTDFKSVTYGNGKYYAVGDQSSIYTSADCNKWQSVTVRDSLLGLFAEFQYITYIETQFFLLSKTGVILTSKDGAAWKYVYVDPGLNCLNCVVKGDNAYIAIGNKGTVVLSNDGATWGPMKDLKWSITENNLYSIIYAGNRFLAVGQGEFCYISKNKGVDWVIDTMESYQWNRLTAIICVNDTLIVTELNGVINVAPAPKNSIKGNSYQKAVSKHMTIACNGKQIVCTLHDFLIEKYARASIYDVLGKQLRFYTISPQIKTFSQNINLPAGRYFFSIGNNNRSIVSPFVIK